MTDSVGEPDGIIRPRLTVLLTRWYLTLLVFLMPLKFGIAVSSVEIGFFPLSYLEWAITPWPAFLLPTLSGIGLILSAATGCSYSLNRLQILCLTAFSGLLCACLIGLIRTTELDYSQSFIWHLTGALALTLSALFQANADPAFRRYALCAAALGVLLSAASGWQQVKFGGYEQTAEYVRQLEDTGIGGPPEKIIARLQRRRASGPFVYPNSFAAHLLLTGPLAVALAWQGGKRLHPARISQPLLASAALIVVGGAFVFTGSRAAVLALGLGACAVTGVWLVRRRRWSLLAGATMAVLVVSGLLLIAVNRNRSLSSVGARAGYYRAGLAMFSRMPLTGVGLGEFFPWYMRLKPEAAEDTRNPHSAAILFLSQCGIVGGLAVLFWVVASLYLLAGGRRLIRCRDPAGLAVLGGGVAWLAHSMVDFNLQIPATVGTFGLLTALATGPAPEARKHVSGRSRVVRQAAATAFAVLSFIGVWRLPGELAYQRFYIKAFDPRASWQECKNLAETARRLLPLSPYPDIVLSKRAAAAGKYAESARALGRALERVPHRGSLWYALAGMRAGLGDYEGARQAYSQAILWQPNSDRRKKPGSGGPG